MLVPVAADQIDKLCHAQAWCVPIAVELLWVSKVYLHIWHEIADDQPLQEGDLISIDVSLFVDGFHGDYCGSIIVGKGDSQLQRLIDTTKESVANAIEI